MVPDPDPRALFDFLEGSWEIERSIPENQASMRGTAQFVRSSADKDALDYREDGELHRLETGEKFTAFRNYRYVREDETIAAYFADGLSVGKLFHRLKPICDSSAPSILVMEGDHRCGRDDYHSTYRIIGEDRFDIVHRVTGPEKNYTSTTIYHRIHPALSTQP